MRLARVLGRAALERVVGAEVRAAAVEVLAREGAQRGGGDRRQHLGLGFAFGLGVKIRG